MKTTLQNPLLLISALLMVTQMHSAAAVELEAVDQAYANGNYHQAVIGYARALQEQPYNIEIKTRLAASYHYQGQLAPAEKILREVLTVDKQYVPALLELGQIRSQQQSWEAALKLYQRAVSAAPNIDGV